MKTRRFFLAAGGLPLLAGCGLDKVLGPPEAGMIYPVRPEFAAGSGQKVAWALAVLRPDVAPGLDSDRIALMQPDGSMDFYAKANYPDRVPPLVQRALLDGFEASGRIEAVAPEQAALHAEYNLGTEVKDFAAHYAEVDGVPKVTVALTAQLSTAHGRVIVGSFAVTQSVTASANSAGAVAQALQQALGAAVKAIVDWTLTAPVPATQQPLSASPGKPAEQLLHDATQGANRARAPAH
ncbi:MAG TPA: ABC-type transport auxiliary lipoprotein family protein [Rhizomicrobium sp.]|nr:ABC-type transport auxiliary lipoprotein family protein [Rhizomicrobium sp.]